MIHIKFKENQELIADDIGYWGPKYNHTNVKVTSCQHPLYVVKAYDGSSYSVHCDMLVTIDDFYDQASGRAAFDVPDIPKELSIKCQCGTSSVYGDSVGSDAHSHWCDVYKKKD